MLPVHKQLENPLTKAHTLRDRELITQLFPELTGSPTRYLALRRYVYNCPERFFDVQAFDFVRDWLRQRDTSHRQELHTYLVDNERDINRALHFLREINSEHWHDAPLEANDDYGRIRVIDTQIHPTYLRLVEAVLTPLVRIIAHFSRIDRGKGTEGLKISSVAEELISNSAEILVHPYRQLVRNGIAHGGITYLRNEIRYRDTRGNEETMSSAEVIRLCDDLLDTCNGIAAAFKVFWVLSHNLGYILPQEFLIEELQEETRTPWWNIEGCVESEIGAKRQLLVYARPNTRDVLKVHWSIIQSGVLAEFFAPGYDRYFFSLRSHRAWPGWAGFDGKRLHDLRTAGASELVQYREALEDNLIFFVPRPALPKYLRPLDTYWQSMKLNWPLAREQMRTARGIPQIVCRNASIHRNGWRCVLNGDVVLKVEDTDAALAVRTNRKRIVNKVLRAARAGTSNMDEARHLPLGFARIAVFRKDYRRRRLSGFGLGEDLICTVQYQKISKIRTPDLFGSTVEIHGKWRIAWNKRWLESMAQSNS